MANAYHLLSLFLTCLYVNATFAQKLIKILDTKIYHCAAEVSAIVLNNSTTVEISYDTSKAKGSLAVLLPNTSVSSSQQVCYVNLLIIWEPTEDNAFIESIIISGVARLDKGVDASVNTMVVWDKNTAPVLWYTKISGRGS